MNKLFSIIFILVLSTCIGITIGVPKVSATTAEPSVIFLPAPKPILNIGEGSAISVSDNALQVSKPIIKWKIKKIKEIVEVQSHPKIDLNNLLKNTTVTNPLDLIELSKDMKNNTLAIEQMIRLSKQVRLSREARHIIRNIDYNNRFIIIKGVHCVQQSESELLILELKLKATIASLCESLIGFDSNKSIVIDYISSFDLANNEVQLCSNDSISIVGKINLVEKNVVYFAKGREEKPKGE